MATFLYGLMCVISASQTFLSILFVTALIFRLRRNKQAVCIVVLGDIGRSPRMQYHAKSLIAEGYEVNFVGYSGSAPINALRDNDKVSFTYLTEWPKKFPVPGFINYLLKAIYYALQLLIVLMIRTTPGHFLVQNPPSIPSLCIVWLVSCLKGSSFITDWHNYGYTILSMNVKRKNHPLVRFSKWYEGFFGYLSDKNICVTKAMKSDLKIKWNIEANVLYDKPPERFQELSDHAAKQIIFSKLKKEGCFDEYKTNENMWNIILKLCSTSKDFEENPAIIISSTSWTEDEDFSMLLDALKMYETRKSGNLAGKLPPLICIITGKGPLKEYYKEVIRKTKFKHVVVITPWLVAEDYPTIIGSGDVGICLHLSSSGLDLPMKVVDMYGCCLPVCAVNFSCLGELVKHDLNGLVFKTGDELADQIIELLTGFPYCEKLKRFRNNLRDGFQKERWHDNWKSVMLPMLKAE